MTAVEPPKQELDRKGVKPLPLLLLYLAVVFAGGALAAPAIYFAVNAIGGHSEGWQELTNFPFHRYVHRSILALALLGLWPVCRMSGMTWRGLGLRFSWGELKNLGMGMAVGFISLDCLVVLTVFFGSRILQQPPNLGSVFVKIVLTGIGVAFIEELIFRGFLFGSMRSASRWKLALFFSSVIYALVHFFSKPAAPHEITWFSGFFILKEMMSGFFDLHTLIPGFINLALAGAVLTLAYQISGTLSFSIGLHAGWIFWMQSVDAFTVPSRGANVSFWGTKKVIDGWSATIVLLITLGVIILWLRRKYPKT